MVGSFGAKAKLSRSTLATTYYRENGVPRVIQHDQGPEFDGAVSRLCKKLQIKVINGLPYHPQSQGKVERGHRSLRKKISYDFSQ